MYNIYSIEYSEECSIIYHHILTVDSKEEAQLIVDYAPYGVFSWKLVSSN